MKKGLLIAYLALASLAAVANRNVNQWDLSDPESQTPFNTKTSAENGRWIESDSVRVMLPSEALLNVRGGEFRINDGDYSAAPQLIRSGDAIRVRLVTNSAWHKTTEAQLTIGKIATVFKVVLADTSPDPFTFTAQSDVARSTNIESNIVTIAGIDMATPISITGGYYRIDGGSWTQAAGTITVGQTVQVYVTSSSAYSASTSATLTVGDYSTVFTVTTAAAGDGGYGGGGSGGGGYDDGGGYGGGSVSASLLAFLAWLSLRRRGQTQT